MPFIYIRRAAVLALALIATPSCTVKDSQAPPLTGPSGLALTLNVNAIPDSISQDGGSQASVKITAIGPDGRPLSGVPIRVDMMVNGVATDFGTLSARSIVTNSDGVATVVYTAPPSPTNGVFGTCNSLPGNCVSIVATATATNFASANPQQVLIRLVPTGVILPNGGAPTASFNVAPASPSANLPAQFDASASCGSALASGGCPVTAPVISSYSWNFGDGQTATGRNVSHSFALPGTYTTTLTVTNALGASASKQQVLTVGSGALPTPSFTVSPTAPAVGQSVFFNGSASTAGQGHTIASYRWSFGDGNTDSGATVSHSYVAAGTYSVQLTVTDESGQSVTSSATTVIVGSGTSGPTAVFTYSPPSPVTPGTTVTFDATPSTNTPAGTAPVIFQWQFECSAPSIAPACTDADVVTTTTSPTIRHTYSLAGKFSVKLTEFDTAGRSNSTSRLITVQ